MEDHSGDYLFHWQKKLVEKIRMPATVLEPRAIANMKDVAILGLGPIVTVTLTMINLSLGIRQSD